MRIWVRCEDGKIRHQQPFSSKAEARRFAEWGHVCTNDHDLTEEKEGTK